MGHEFDDNNLPPVDVDIPDDASELDREVQAYRREVRWQRRYERWRQVWRGVRRRGVTGPLAIGVALVAALCAALLVVTARPSSQSLQQSGTAEGRAEPGEIGGRLPDIKVTVVGKTRPLRDLAPAVLVLTPRDCECLPALHDLGAHARDYGVPVYLVESGNDTPDRNRLARRIGTEGQQPQVLEDPDGVLAHTYGTAGLTAILVDRTGTVSTVVPHATTEADWASQLAPLRGSWQNEPR